MQNDHIHNILTKYLSGNAEPEEEKELLTWVAATPVNQAFFEEMVEIWEASNLYEDEPFPVQLPKAWKNIEQKITTTVKEKVPQKSRRLFLYQWVSVAAVIACLIGVGWWWFFKNAEDTLKIVQTTIDQQERIKLPDGTQIWLNENTTISYNWKENPRQINLVGEAFFEVTKQEQQQFIITTGKTQTTVLGTSFNVRAYPQEEEIEVAVNTGKVALSKLATTESIVLEKGETGVFDKKTERVQSVKRVVANALSWQTNKLIFNNTNMDIVAKTLERHFDITIEIANPRILNCPFQGTYENPQLQDILEALEFALNLSIQKKKDKYIINGKGC